MPLPNEPARVNLRLTKADDDYLVAELARRGMSRQDFFTRLLHFYRDQPNAVKLNMLGQLDKGDARLAAEALLRGMRGK